MLSQPKRARRDKAKDGPPLNNEPEELVPAGLQRNTLLVESFPPQRHAVCGNRASTNLEPTLLSLPDLPLLRVLSFLPMEDLAAAGAACCRLGSLARAHWPLWRGKKFGPGVPSRGLWDLLRVSPRVDKLCCDDTHGDGYAHARCFESCESDRSAAVVSTLEVRTSENVLLACLIREFAPRVKHLCYGGPDLNMLYFNLQYAMRIEVLDLDCENVADELGGRPRWPQNVVLPRLHTVVIHEVDHNDVQPALDAFGSLLQAHRGQLRSVTLHGPEVLPLLNVLDARPSNSNLQRLEVETGKGAAEGLRPFQPRLKELIVHCDKRTVEMTTLLKSWSGPLERLELDGVTLRMLRVLQEGSLAGLRHLTLGDASSKADLQSTLAGLPLLHSLILHSCHAKKSLEMLCNMAPTTIPALELLIFKNLREERCSKIKEDCPRVAPLVPAVKRLVRRAPLSLHCVMLPYCGGVDHWAEQGERYGTIFYRHSSAAEAECPLCAEAVSVTRFIHSGSDDVREIKATKITRILV